MLFFDSSRAIRIPPQLWDRILESLYHNGT
jgi:hypothetical protein